MPARLQRVMMIAALLTATVVGAGAQAIDPWFSVEEVNRGLGAPPDLIDRQTPQATVESLMTAARRDNFEAAAHLLDLRDLPTEQQAELGAEFARKLDLLIERRVWIDWSSLPDRPDALETGATDQNATAGEPRRSLRLWTLDLEGRPASIRLNRLKPEDGDPVWVFAQQTVANIPELYEAYRPAGFELMLPPELRRRTDIGLLRWEVIALPLLLVAGSLTGWAVYRILRIVSRWASRPLTTAIVRATYGPLVFGSVVAVVSAAKAYVFIFSGGITAVLDPLIVLGFLIALIWLTINIADEALNHLSFYGGTDLTDRTETRNRSLATRIAAARRAFIVLVTVVGLAIVLASAGLFETLGMGLLASAGAVTLILGFAARHILSNIMSSLQIALNQSARIGDRIVFRDHLCHVERINFTYIQLRDWDDTRIVVPVTEFVSEPFANWTLQEPEMLRIIKLKFAHDADVGALRTAFFEVVETLDKDELGGLDSARVSVAGQDVFGIDVWFFLPCADPNTSWTVAAEAREKIMRRAGEIARETNRPVFPEAAAAEAA